MVKLKNLKQLTTEHSDQKGLFCARILDQLKIMNVCAVNTKNDLGVLYVKNVVLKLLNRM